MPAIRQLAAIGTFLSLSLASYGAPITATLVTIPIPVEYATQVLVVNAPGGVEQHYLGDHSIDVSKVLVSQTGKVVLTTEVNNNWPRYYVLESLAGPGNYGGIDQLSPYLETVTVTDFRDYHFEYLKQRYGLIWLGFWGPTYSELQYFDRYGNFYGTNRYIDGHEVDFKDNDVLLGDVAVTWRNFQPYPIPEPSTTSLVSLGPGAVVIARGFLKTANRRQ